MPPDDKKKEGLTDMYLHSAGVLGELLYEAKETFLTPLHRGLRETFLLSPEEPEPPPPPPPPRRPLAKSDLQFDLHVMPFPIGFAGGSVTVFAEVTYKGTDARGQPGRWPYPDKWVDVLFQKVPHPGPGPFTMDLLDIENYGITLRAIVSNGKTEKLKSVTVRSVCGARHNATELTFKDLASALFSEGGSRSNPPLDDRELLAVSWAIRNRYDALLKAVTNKDKRHWDYFAARWFKDADGKPYEYGFALSYYRLLRGRKQFTGVDGKQYEIAANPLTKVTTLKECQRVQKCIEVVDAVFGKGQPEDPYKGQGNPDYPGVFYYKEKGNSPVHPGPILPELTGKDHHFYQGLDEDYRP